MRVTAGGLGGAGLLAERSVNIAPQVSTGMKPTAGKKRKSDGAPTIDPDDIELPEDMEISRDPHKQGGGGHVMKLNGRDKGSGGDTYFAAAGFFKRRQLAGVKTCRQKKSKPNTSTSNSSTNTTAAGARTSSSSTGKSKKEEIAEVEAANDVSQIKLTGEDDDTVPVMDTCDDVRAKINKYLRETPHATGASVIGTINRALPEGSRNQAFGPDPFPGSSAPADPARGPRAWSFTRRLRVFREAPTEAEQTEIPESVWTWKRPDDPGGIDLEDSSRTRVWVGPGIPDVYEDKFGKLQIM
ncbi:hypothetical protein H2204_006392 [Knufia peltigerae]|uniref:Uncharacterized protein n=1 Tax=Knufia peltigerae TaxID=1002370 RepID=A0AA38Y402_9EURO|nr:hypothetical protein H2204_006392 [Knufia peltigerae]